MSLTNIIPVILTTSKNLTDRVPALTKQLEELKFNTPKIWIGEPAANHETLVQAICKTHYDITVWFSHHSTSNQHLLVLEDDCQFLDETTSKLYASLNSINKWHPRWRLLTLGQVNLGFTFPSFVSLNVWACTMPFMAHSYILNGDWVRNNFHKWTEKEWIRPYAVEGWLKFPPYTKFSIVPGITTQSVLPKEMKEMLPQEIYENLPLYGTTNMIDFAWITLTIVCFIWLGRFFYFRQQSRL